MMVEADLALVKSQQAVARWTWPDWRRSTPTRSVSSSPSAQGCSRSCRRACCRWYRRTCRWSRGCRRPNCGPGVAPSPVPGPVAVGAGGVGAGRSGGPPGTWRRTAPPPVTTGPGRPIPAPAQPTAPGDPGLHRRVHRGVHHPRRLGLVGRPPVPHPPARPRDGLGRPHRRVRRRAGRHGRRGDHAHGTGGRAAVRRPPSVLGAWAPPVMGMAFAFAWTPCIGPVLGSVLALAAGTGGSATGGIALLLAYSLGLGVPFLLSGLAFGRMTDLLARVGPAAHRRPGRWGDPDRLRAAAPDRQRGPRLGPHLHLVA